MLKFLGILLGVAIRTKKPLDLHLAPCVWKLLVGVALRVDDLEEVTLDNPLTHCSLGYKMAAMKNLSTTT